MAAGDGKAQSGPTEGNEGNKGRRSHGGACRRVGRFVIFVFFCGLLELHEAEPSRLHPMKTREPRVS